MKRVEKKIVKIISMSDECEQPNQIIQVAYPHQFLAMKDIDNCMIKDSKSRTSQYIDTIVKHMNENGLNYLQLDLADIMFDLNYKVRSNLLQILKPNNSNVERFEDEKYFKDI